MLNEQQCAIDKELRLVDIAFNSIIELVKMTAVTTVHCAADIMKCVI